MTKKNVSFNLSGNSTLTLKNLYAQVTVRKGSAGNASVELNGDEELLKLISVTQPNSNEVLIEGEEMDGGGITVVQSGRRSSISVRGNGVVIGGNIIGGSIVGGSNVVIVNGKVISGNVTQIDGGAEMPTITVTVPEGTELDVESVEDLNSQGLNGKLYLSLDGQGKAKIQDVTNAKVNCSGQTRAEISNTSGDLKVSCSGQSRATVKGNFGDVNADASGQSQVRIVGNCKDCEGSASGQSTISLSGHASGKIRKHESGQSSVDID